MEAVICKSVNFSYPKTEYPVLHDVSLSVQRGEFCLVIGESAVGKTTLMKLLTKKTAPAGDLSGEVILNGSVGYVSQNIDESIICDRVRSELSFGLTNMGMSRERIELLVAETASYFNLADKLDCDISALSGGEKQMLILASVMIMKPDILVLDEPCAQLDPVSSQRFAEMVKQLHRDFGITVIIAEHNANDIFEYAGQVVLMDKGTVVFGLPPDEAVLQMKKTNSKMLSSAPLHMTVFDGVSCVNTCRERLKNSNVKSLEPQKISGDTALRIRHIFFSYTKHSSVINDLSLNVYSGKINAIVGPNASGKSTLLKIIAGVLKAYKGRVKADKHISLLCQNVYDLFTRETCGEEVKSSEITAFLGIDDIMDRHPYDLSGGQAQRLALAKVLETGADILLLDEPTKGYDPTVKKRLAQILSGLCAQGKTILLVTHDIEFAGRYADVVSFLSDGRIINTAPRREFFSSLSLYTTSVSKMTNGIADNVVSIDDLRQAGAFDE